MISSLGFCARRTTECLRTCSSIDPTYNNNASQIGDRMQQVASAEVILLLCHQETVK